MDGLWRLSFKAESLDDFALSHKVREAVQRALDTSLRKAELFVGTYGTGKTSVARFLSQQISKTEEMLECGNFHLLSVGEQKKALDDFKTRLGTYNLSRFFESSHKKRVIIFDEWHNVDLGHQRSFSHIMDKDKTAGMIFTSNSLDSVDMLIQDRCEGGLSFDVVDATATANKGSVVTLKNANMSSDEWKAELVRVAGRYVERAGYVVDDELSRKALDEELIHSISIRRYIGALQVKYETDGTKK